MLLTATAGLAPAQADFAGNVNFFMGQKSLDSGDWQPLEDQFAFGAISSFGASDWPVQIAGDVLVSGDEQTESGIEFTAVTFEFDAGIRWLIYKKGKVFPYIGAGLGLMGAAAQGDYGFGETDASDATFGFWADAGVFFRLGDHFNIGVDLRYSDASVDLVFDSGVVARDVNVGGFSYGLLLGFGW
jgi:hypothetical protein